MFDHLTARQRTVLDVLIPGGMLTVEQIARGARLPRWKAKRDLGALCREGMAFRDRAERWQISPLLRRPPRRAVR
ncbi:hypothetical protein [Nocardia rhizosphaerae]|uniref:Transcriptional regulator n=1 Tax=Nocardia rhizosphaerae TaxID=1691571 RepID=A0ABV8LDJ3_9NOCA